MIARTGSRLAAPTPRGFQRAFARVVPVALLGVLPVVLLAWSVVLTASDDRIAVDFHHELYPETKLVLDGIDPYPQPDADLSDGTNAIWPIAAVVLVAPFSLLPPNAADWAMTIAVIASLFAALLVAGVRDWRVLGVVCYWPAVINAVQTANLTLPICLLTAVAWRLRDRWWGSGSALGVALALKFFVWPLLVWQAVTHRWRAAVLAAGLAAASLLLVTPFISLGDYVRLLRNLSDTFDESGYTIYAVLTDLGLPDGLAHVVWLAVGLAVLAIAARRRSFSLAIGASLLLTPIVWLHFFALLAVALAIARPRLEAIWFAPLLMWIAPGTFNGQTWQTIVPLTVTFAILVYCGRAERPSALGRANARAA